MGSNCEVPTASAVHIYFRFRSSEDFPIFCTACNLLFLIFLDSTAAINWKSIYAYILWLTLPSTSLWCWLSLKFSCSHLSLACAVLSFTHNSKLNHSKPQRSKTISLIESKWFAGVELLGNCPNRFSPMELKFFRGIRNEINVHSICETQHVSEKTLISVFAGRVRCRRWHSSLSRHVRCLGD